MITNLTWNLSILPRSNLICVREQLLPQLCHSKKCTELTSTPQMHLTRDDDFLEPQISSCRSQMYRARRQNMPPLPATRADINIQGQWSTTNDNNRFLLHQDDQMIIFSTDEDLQKLSEADQVFMDGTFKVAPALFMQLFSLHIIFRGFFLPLVYALLQSKSSETYYSLFEILKERWQH